MDIVHGVVHRMALCLLDKGQWVSGSVGQWVSESVGQRVSGAASQWVSESVGQWVRGTVGQGHRIWGHDIGTSQRDITGGHHSGT